MINYEPVENNEGERLPPPALQPGVYGKPTPVPNAPLPPPLEAPPDDSISFEAVFNNYDNYIEVFWLKNEWVKDPIRGNKNNWAWERVEPHCESKQRKYPLNDWHHLCVRREFIDDERPACLSWPKGFM